MKCYFVKIQFLFIALFVSSIFVQCTKDEFDVNDPDVGLYVKELKNGTFHTDLNSKMPKFKKTDISRLLEYAKDTSVVKSFPSNPNSSIAHFNPTLTQALLWTIESIRIGGEYPSLTCQLFINGDCGSDLIQDPQAILYVRDLYQSWWDKVSSKASSVDYYQQSALEGTNYRWQ